MTPFATSEAEAKHFISKYGMVLARHHDYVTWAPGTPVPTTFSKQLVDVAGFTATDGVYRLISSVVSLPSTDGIALVYTVELLDIVKEETLQNYEHIVQQFNHNGLPNMNRFQQKTSDMIRAHLMDYDAPSSTFIDDISKVLMTHELFSVYLARRYPPAFGKVHNKEFVPFEDVKLKDYHASDRLMVLWNDTYKRLTVNINDTFIAIAPTDGFSLEITLDGHHLATYTDYVFRYVAYSPQKMYDIITSEWFYQTLLKKVPYTEVHNNVLLLLRNTVTVLELTGGDHNNDQ